MLNSYFQNAQVGVTKETYYEICEQLGTEPVEEEIPIEIEDFPDEIQEAFSIYFRLRDEWDGFSGSYLGKSFTGLRDILDIYQVSTESRQTILDWINLIDRARSKCIQDSKPKEKANSPA